MRLCRHKWNSNCRIVPADRVVGVDFLSCGVGFSELRTAAHGEGGVDGAGGGGRGRRAEVEDGGTENCGMSAGFWRLDVLRPWKGWVW